MAKEGRHHVTPDQRATAVARVLAGESRRKVADDVGVAEGSVRRWIKAAERRGTTQERKLAESAEELARRIERRQEEVRDALLERISELVPETESLREVGVVFGIVTDKILLGRGEPTQITRHLDEDQVDKAIEKMLERDGTTNGSSPR